MQTGDVLLRISGLMTLVSGLFNGLMSVIWFLSLVWVCVGVVWIIPMITALLQIVLGIFMIATGKQVKLLGFAPLLGLVSSGMNLNIFGGVMDLIAIGLGIGGFVVAGQEAQLEDKG